MKELKDVIKQARKEKFITIFELAKCLGVSQAYIVQLERGDFEPIRKNGGVTNSAGLRWG